MTKFNFKFGVVILLVMTNVHLAQLQSTDATTETATTDTNTDATTADVITATVTDATTANIGTDATTDSSVTGATTMSGTDATTDGGVTGATTMSGTDATTDGSVTGATTMSGTDATTDGSVTGATTMSGTDATTDGSVTGATTMSGTDATTDGSVTGATTMSGTDATTDGSVTGATTMSGTDATTDSSVTGATTMSGTDATTDGGVTGATTMSGTDATTAESGTDATTAESGTDATTAASGTDATTAASGTDATTAESGTDATTADSGTDATTAESVTDATTAESGTDATTAESATEATTAESGTDATTAESGTDATTAESATAATTAESATEATTAESGTDATTAESGTDATTAESATAATTADSGTGATTAASGTNATTAASGTDATTAESGTDATTAESGTGATTAASGTNATTVESATDATTAASGTNATTAESVTDATTAATGINATTAESVTGATTAASGTNATTAESVTGATTAASGTTTMPTTNVTGTSEDFCSANPCMHNGTCVNGVSSYTCTCSPGYTDSICMTEIDECATLQPCANNATCTDMVNDYFCNCTSAQFYGKNCSLEIDGADECASNPCQNGASCTDGNFAYTCDCLPGFTDVSCETDIDDCAASPCVHGSCTDGVNMFTCSCPAGFTGALCDVDIDDCATNPCMNGATCVDNLNSYMCECMPGYTGMNCSTDINECAGVTCLNGGNCTDGINMFTCNCPQHVSGTTCEILDPYYTDWGAYSNCSLECGTGSVRTRTRNCTNIQGAMLDSGNCKGVGLGNPTSTEACNVPECISAYNPCTDPTTPYPCGIHNCSVIDNSGNYICNCRPGYIHANDGANMKVCVDEDECSWALNDCLMPNGGFITGVNGCVNSAGSYQCTCAEGYMSNGPRSCMDIDECSSPTMNNCDTDGRATCTNLPGNSGKYSCACSEGYTGAGTMGTCIEMRLMDISGHSKLQYVDASTPLISDLVCPMYGFPVNDQIYPCLYFTQHGVVAFTTSTASSDPRREFRSASSVPLANYLFPTGYSEEVLVAPYWTKTVLLDENDGRGVYHHIMNDAELAQIEMNSADLVGTAMSSFVPRFGIVITWKKLQYSSQEPNQTVTFQTGIATDGVNTIVKTVYADRGMNWNLALNKATTPNALIRVGHIRVNSEMNRFGREWEFSYAGVENKTRIERIDTEDLSSISYLGGMKNGRSIYFLSNNDPGSFINPGLACNTWLINDGNFNGRAYAAVCPDAYSQITSSWQLHSVSMVRNREVECYRKRFPLLMSNDAITPSCCYYSNNTVTNGDLSMVRVSGVNKKNLLQRFPSGSAGAMADMVAYEQCCELSDIHCMSFLEHRPRSNADNFRAPGVAGTSGDPHITTLDGLQYTFNGFGEYTLLKSATNYFTLQGRTMHAVTTRNISLATVFSSIAAQQINPGSTNSDIVELRMNANGDGIDVYVNKVLDAASNYTGDGTTFHKVVVKETPGVTGSMSMIFNTDVEIRVAAALNMTTVTVAAPAGWKGNFEGLMGNFNDDTSDDISYPNGTSISITSTEEEIFDVGKSWMIVPSDSLFQYENGETAETYGNASYVPLFYNLDTMFDDNATRQAAIDACGGIDNLNRECVFDIALTGNQAVGEATLAAGEALTSEKATLENFPPVIQDANTTVINVVGGEDLSPAITIVAVDPNAGDTVTYSLGAGAPMGVSINSATGVLSWTAVPSNLTVNDSVTIIATDGTATSSITPPINLCLCQNGGTCVYGSSSAGLNMATCTCPSGLEGDYCQTDINGCADNPCFSNVACLDVAAPGTGFTCGPCPIGLVGDGSICTDENECMAQTSPCSQMCVNLPGSFQCQCQDGYILGPDLTTCVDIDECRQGTDNCAADATCANTIGSFTCTCNPGYAGSGDICTDVDECLSSNMCGDNAICANTVGSYMCNCQLGYSMDPISGLCVEIDECQGDHACSQVCIDGVAIYTCACNTGFRLDATDAITCIPEQVCDGTQAATCKDTGDIASDCAVVNGEVTCICPPKYVLNGNNECVDINECSTASGNQCNLVTSVCNNTIGNYQCDCKPGYTLDIDGRTCIDIDECATGTDNCDATYGVCTNLQGSFSCSCVNGYTMNASRACNDVDECASPITNDCDVNYGNCTNIPGTYLCTCNSGFTGNGIICADQNECSLADQGGCVQGCSNSIGSFSCFCGNGYTLNADGKTCDDKDECLREADHGCYSNDYCTNSIGSYTCSCPAGFTLDTDFRTCIAINQCSANHGCSHTCAYLNNTDTCQCPKGLQLDNTGLNCTDIDECASSSTNPCLASDNVKCVNTYASVSCECTNSTYYQQVEARKCIDIDECGAGTATCPANSLCVNKVEGYDCNCVAGYTMSNGVCVDVDECTAGTDNCDSTLGICNNTAGGYTCACIDGYSGDGVTCTDINECLTNNGGCDVARGRGTCVNYDGGHNCTCISGYVIDNMGLLCEDINECNPANPMHDCVQDCVNINGGYSCSCQAGFRLAADQKNCTVESECAANNTCSDLCAMVGGVETCICQNSFYKLDTDNKTCIDVNECAVNNPCTGNNTQCNNTVGGYICSCLNGYKLTSDGLRCEDRDGNWGPWSSWSNCTATCGGGTYSRTRECNNPTPQGSGLACPGDASETAMCNTQFCPKSEAESTYGVILTLNGLTPTQISAIQSDIIATIVSGINTWCSSSSNFGQCCPNSGTRNSSSLMTFTTTNFVEMGEGYPRYNSMNKSQVLIVAKADRNNALCADGSISLRKRRAVTFNNLTELVLPATVLQIIVTDSTVQNNIITTITTTYPTANVTITTIIASSDPDDITTTVATTTVGTDCVAAGTCAAPLAGWIIAVAVVGALLGVILIVVIVIVVIKKRPTKVNQDSRENVRDAEANRRPNSSSSGHR